MGHRLSAIATCTGLGDGSRVGKADPRVMANRLSDLLFVMARALNRHAGGAEPMWDRQRGH